MAAPNTYLSVRETLMRIANETRDAWKKAVKARSGDVKQDEAILAEIDRLGNYMEKLKISFLQKLDSDSQMVKEHGELLVEIKDMLDDIIKENSNAIRNDHYIRRVSKHIRGIVKGKIRKAERKGMNYSFEAAKKKKEAEEKKEKAKELMGKKYREAA